MPCAACHCEAFLNAWHAFGSKNVEAVLVFFEKEKGVGIHEISKRSAEYII